MQKVETTIVPMRLTPTEIEELDRVVVVGKFKSRSSALRNGLYLLMDAHGIRPQTHIAIEDERKKCRPRCANVRFHNVAKDAKKPSTVTPSPASSNGKAKRRKAGASKVK